MMSRAAAPALLLLGAAVLLLSLLYRDELWCASHYRGGTVCSSSRSLADPRGDEPLLRFSHQRLWITAVDVRHGGGHRLAFRTTCGRTRLWSARLDSAEAARISGEIRLILPFSGPGIVGWWSAASWRGPGASLGLLLMALGLLRLAGPRRARAALPLR